MKELISYLKDNPESNIYVYSFHLGDNFNTYLSMSKSWFVSKFESEVELGYEFDIEYTRDSSGDIWISKLITKYFITK